MSTSSSSATNKDRQQSAVSTTPTTVTPVTTQDSPPVPPPPPAVQSSPPDLILFPLSASSFEKRLWGLRWRDPCFAGESASRSFLPWYAQTTQFYGYFSSMSQPLAAAVVPIVLSLAAKYPDLERTLLIGQGTRLRRFYETTGFADANAFWTNQIRRIQKTQVPPVMSNSLARVVSTIFATMMAFCSYCYDTSFVSKPHESPDIKFWTAELAACFKKMDDALQLRLSDLSQNADTMQLLGLLNLEQEWLYSYEFFRTVCTECPAPVGIIPLAFFSKPATSEFRVLPNGINAVGGYSESLKPLLGQVYDFLSAARANGNSLGGCNILRLVYASSQSALVQTAKQLAVQILPTLLAGVQHRMETLPTLPGASPRFAYIVKRVSQTFDRGLCFYVAFFLIGGRNREVQAARTEMLAIYELIQGVPYHCIGTPALHFVVQLCSLASIVVGQRDLYRSFVEILPSRMQEKLGRVQERVERGDFGSFEDPRLDVML